MARGHHILALLGGGAAIFATSLAHAQCTMDTECKGDRVCDGGSCVAPNAAAAAARPLRAAPAPTEGAPADARGENAVAAEAAPPKPAQPKMQRHSTGMMAGGIVMVSLAPVALLVAGLSGLGKALCRVDDYDSERTCSGYDPVIYSSLAGAFVLVGVGVPLLVIGAKKEPVDASAASAIIAPWATPTSGGLSLRLRM
jgi:hypothetical protein